jgi:hypothetical protein
VASSLPGLTKPNSARVISTLQAIDRHIADDEWPVVGELASLHHLSTLGAGIPAHSLNGIDIAIQGGMEGLLAGFSERFQVTHLHRQPQGLYGVLVDLETGMEVRVSPARHRGVPLSVDLPAGGYMGIQTLPHQIVWLVEDLLAMEQAVPPVDAIQYMHMSRLMAAVLEDDVELRRIDSAWRTRGHRGGFMRAMLRAYGLRDLYPHLVQPRRSAGWRLSWLFRRCPVCIRDNPRFPLARSWRLALLRGRISVTMLAARRRAPRP